MAIDYFSEIRNKSLWRMPFELLKSFVHNECMNNNRVNLTKTCFSHILPKYCCDDIFLTIKQFINDNHIFIFTLDIILFLTALIILLIIK